MTLGSGLPECTALARRLLAAKGISTVSEKKLVNGIQVNLSLDGVSCGMNYYWSAKKGFSFVPAGGDSGLLATAACLLGGKPLPHPASGLRIGTDEAGKGDWFGPLVAAGVACDDSMAKLFVSLGVADSKTLTNERVLRLLDTLTGMGDLAWASRIVPPPEYNSLFSDFKRRGMNSLDIQAMAHGEVITDLYARTRAGTVVVDRFCSGQRLSQWLPRGDYELMLRCRAEDDPVVAAASVIARGLYLRELDRLSRDIPVRLTPGAGAPADALGRELVRALGNDVLYSYAKVHFGNYARALTP